MDYIRSAARLQAFMMDRCIAIADGHCLIYEELGKIGAPLCKSLRMYVCMHRTRYK